MKIAVIGWGSLIWDPGALNIAPGWNEDGPLLPIEFARFSSGKRLTLVLVEGSPLQPTLWARSQKGSLAEAARDLQAREGTLLQDIGTCSARERPSSKLQFHRVVQEWLGPKGLDGAVWTALGPKSPEGKSFLISEDERLAWLAKLIEGGESDAAREYIELAPSQVRTPLRDRIRRELGWG